MGPRKVAFQDVELRLYARTLGDHPGCKFGPPLTIEWDHISSTKLTVDGYEKERQHTRRQRVSQLKVSSNERRRILRQCNDVTEEQMCEASREVRRVSKMRKRSSNFIVLDPVEAYMESARRKISKKFTRKDF